MLYVIPTLLFLGGKLAVVHFEVWAPEPVEYCVAHKYRNSLYFNCKTPGGNVRWAVEGINKA